MNIFTYGTLMDREIMYRVSGSHHAYLNAVLFDYARKTVRDKVYPGIMPTPGATVAGVLYLNISLKSIERLDRYEGSFYQRVLVMARCQSGQTVPAWTYVVQPSRQAQLTSRLWSFTEFNARYRDAYLADLSFPG